MPPNDASLWTGTFALQDTPSFARCDKVWFSGEHQRVLSLIVAEKAGKPQTFGEPVRRLVCGILFIMCPQPNNFHSSGIVEGFNNKAKLTVRKSYGFRSDELREIALYHTLGKLPMPEFTHRFV